MPQADFITPLTTLSRPIVRASKPMAKTMNARVYANHAVLEWVKVNATPVEKRPIDQGHR